MSETVQTPVIDKSSWGPGPWQDEPDRVDFIHAGFACFVRRHESNGQLCGYVGVPREHLEYGKPYQDIEGAIDVHGGLTYSDKCDGDLCHVPAPGMPDDVWWFGFDCAHAYDLAPGVNAALRACGIPERERFFLREDVYRDLAYVRRETESLAEQLAAIGSAGR